MNNTDSKNILLSVIGVAILFVAIVGISYAIFVYVKNGNTANTISTGKISMLYTESDNTISITNAIPTPDSTGKIQKDYFEFTAAANIKGKASIDYEIRARRTDGEDANRLADNVVNLYIEKKEGSEYKAVMEPTTYSITSSSTLNNIYVNKDSMLLYKGTIVSNDEVYKEEKFRLRMWVNENYKMDDKEKIFKLKVDIYSNLNK